MISGAWMHKLHRHESIAAVGGFQGANIGTKHLSAEMATGRSYPHMWVDWRVQLRIVEGSRDAWQTLGEEDNGRSWRRGVTADKPRMGLRERSKKGAGWSWRGCKVIHNTQGWVIVFSFTVEFLEGFKSVTRVFIDYRCIFWVHVVLVLCKSWYQQYNFQFGTIHQLCYFKTPVANSTIESLFLLYQFEPGLKSQDYNIPLGLDVRDICGHSPHAAVVQFERFPRPNSFIYVSQCVLTKT